MACYQSSRFVVKITKTVRGQPMDNEPKDRMESQETNPPRYSHLIYNKGATANQWGQDKLSINGKK